MSAMEIKKVNDFVLFINMCQHVLELWLLELCRKVIEAIEGPR